MLKISEVLKVNKEYKFFNFYYHFDNVENRKNITFNEYIYDYIENLYDNISIEKDITKDDAIKYMLHYFISCFHSKKSMQENIKYVMYTSNIKTKKYFYENYCDEIKLKNHLKTCI